MVWYTTCIVWSSGVRTLNPEDHTIHYTTKGCVTLCMAFKKYLKKKKLKLWKLKYFTMQKYNLKKNPLKETKILQDIIITLL
jgi:hypothetical protein